jgi:transitional endoplasmic reticulum ATPase
MFSPDARCATPLNRHLLRITYPKLIPMPNSPEELLRLRQAYAASPDNMALCMLLVDMELKHGFHPQAEALLRELLVVNPGPWAQRRLVACFEAQNRIDEALVLAESMMASGEIEAEDWAMLAKLQLRTGDADLAKASYQAAMQMDPSFSDDKLEKRLGGRAQSGGGADADPLHIDEEGRERVLAQPGSSIGSEHGEQLREDSATTFDDVGGMEELKKQARMRVILPLEKPEMFEAYGKKAGGGLLLYGPPGCGKTLFARATAGEINASFFNIGIHDVLDPYVGSSEKKLHQIFETARAHAPAVLFFDEIDALASNRRDFSSTTGRQVINVFLSEMDGMDTVNDGILILGATNAPWHLDPAFRRPGRFDRVLFVPPPDELAREEILNMHLRGKPQKSIDVAKIAKRAKEFSGADLRAVIDRAVEEKLEQALETGIPEPLTTKELVRGLKQQAPPLGNGFPRPRIMRCMPTKAASTTMS